MNDTKAIDEERLRADEARSHEMYCDDCGEELSQAEMDNDEETCYDCQKGKNEEDEE
jgi:hypothetical protein